MTDLYIAAAVLVVLSATAFVVTYRSCRYASPRRCNVFAIIALAAILVDVLWARDSVWLARLLPVSSVIILSRWTFVAAGALAAAAWCRLRDKSVRKVVFSVAALAVAGHSTFCVLFRPPAELSGSLWRKGVCMQTSPSSCGAATVATILNAHGIVTTENEMAQLCLTSSTGTTTHGMYRGLTLKTRGTPWRVELAACTLDDLKEETRPCIIFVGLPNNRNVDPRYEQRWGWTPGLLHVVVFYGFVGANRVEIGDPSVGREQWNTEAIRVLWDGKVARLRKR